ncbi:MAG: phosphoribosylformylglycinamidine synthase II, partial [Novosphingobium sp.]|nr:phosphoribosylformylglycinamidine synthase II [Novosphingobium sp.]
RALDFPIVSGNVSLYNESKATGGGSAILPTPAIGGVGLLADYEKMATIAFKAEGETIILIGGESGHLGQSLWLRELHAREDGPPPPVGLELERETGELVRNLIAEGIVSAVHDCSDGGLAVALAEMALAGNLGCEAFTPADRISDAAFWFGEDQARYVVTAPDAQAVVENAKQVGLAAVVLGKTVGGCVTLHSESGEHSLALADLRKAHESFFRDWMEG